MKRVLQLKQDDEGHYTLTLSVRGTFRDQPCAVAYFVYRYDTANPFPGALSYHSPVPLMDGQRPAPFHCEFLSGGMPCYSDLSGLAGERIFDYFQVLGPAGVWKDLEEFFLQYFPQEEADDD